LSHQRDVALCGRLVGPVRVRQVEVGLEVHHRGLDLECWYEFTGVSRLGLHARDEIVNPLRTACLAAHAPVEGLEALRDVGAREVALREQIRRLVVGVAVHGPDVGVTASARVLMITARFLAPAGEPERLSMMVCIALVLSTNRGAQRVWKPMASRFPP
jgi:hypothetical protein